MINSDTAGILRLKYMLLGECRKVLPLLDRAQAVVILPAPLNFPTPFPMFRYQKIGGYREWCCFFCERFSRFCVRIGNTKKFSVLYKPFTAFLYRIRAPPSEI